MAKKKSIFENAKDLIEQGLVSAKSLTGFFRNTNRDKRTIKSTQKAVETFQAGRTNKEAAADLGISTQRYTALKKQISQGKAYSPELRDVLIENAPRQEPSRRSTPRNVEPETLVDVARDKSGVYTFSSLETLQDSGTKVEIIKSFPSKRSAISWWKTIVNSGKYIAVAKDSSGFYNVVAFGKREERPKSYTKHYKNGKSKKVTVIEDKNGRNRVSEIIANNRDYIQVKRGKRK
jgi:hypothetical protein